MSPKPTHHTDHEGARESLKPGEPRERPIITPGWAELNKREHAGDKPDAAARTGKSHRMEEARRVKGAKRGRRKR